jgi:anti-sigma28 factor (negative regulator of flagellin synthesis)
LLKRSKDFAYTVGIRADKKTEVDRGSQMKITDNGFSERIATPAGRTQQTNESARNSSSGSASRTSGSSDTLQLSSIASKLQTNFSDAGRSSRLSAIAQAVKSNSFQVDSMQISKAMVAEAASGRAG